MSRILRSALAIAAGDAIFGLTAVLLFRMAGYDPHAPAAKEFVIASMALGVIAAASGGWVTAAIAGHHRREHAAVLGILIASGALISLVLSSRTGAIWTQVAAVVLMAPAALAGSWPWWSKSANSA
ncbi:MAG: hypothetical protein ACJ74Z_08610 [Bryobacteraceae bacterium]